MATYDDWNSAIADAFTKGIPLGAPVYLAIDDEELATIGAAAFRADASGQDGWTEDFCFALRTKVTGAGAVQLSRVRTQRSSGGGPTASLSSRQWCWRPAGWPKVPTSQS